MNKKSKAFWACATLLYLTVLYFYAAPIITKGPSVLRLRAFDLGTAKDYYSILAAIVTLLFGTAGIALGYFYYKDKNTAEQSAAARERKRKRLDNLIEKIDAYDNQVDTILQRRFSNDSELSQLRSTLTRSFETIVIMLELNPELLGLEGEDLRDIIKVNSFVDKNDLIMRARFSELNQGGLNEIREEYIDLIQNARRACYRRVS